MKHLLYSSTRAARPLVLLLLSLVGLHTAWAAGKPALSTPIPFAPLRVATLPQYTIQDLGPVAPNSDNVSYGYGLNSKGHVLGDGGSGRGAFWNPGVFRIDPIRTGAYDRAGQLDHDSNFSSSASINDKDMVVGRSYIDTITSSQHAFLWDQTLGTIDLGIFGTNVNGFGYSDAAAINAGGFVVGFSSDYTNDAAGPYRAFLWSPTTDNSGNLIFNPDGSFGTLLNLGTLSPNVNGQDGFDGYSQAFGINSRNQVVGYAYSSLGGNHAFLYDGAMHDLGSLYLDPNNAGHFYGSSQALGINENGTIFGDSDNGNGHDGFVHTGTGFLIPGDDIGYLSSVNQTSYALGINGSNAVCGYSYAAGINNGLQDLSTSGFQHAIAYDGTLHDLGSLGLSSDYYSYPYNYGYSDNSQARAINDSSQVVGFSTGDDGQQHAFIYRDGLMYNLDHLLTGQDSANWQLRDAQGINASGQITGYGLHFNGTYYENHTYLLTPAPAVTTLPAPSISHLYLASALAGNPDFTVSINGAGFTLGSVVHFRRTGGTDMPLTTTVQSDSLLYAAVPAALVATPGTVNVTVTNPDSQTSASATFTVYAMNPQPTVTSISPDRMPVKTATDVTITVTGTNFVAGPAALESVAYFNGSPYTPSSVSVDGTHLIFTIPAAASAFNYPQQASVLVRNPPPAVTYPNKDSNTVPVYVSNLVPTIDHFSPDHATAGSPDAFVLYIYGTGLNVYSQVQVNGSGRSAGYDAVNDRMVVTYIYPADIATAGNLMITVTNSPVLPDSSDGGSAEKDFPVISSDNPKPTVTSLYQNTAPANQALTQYVYGTGFVKTSTVKLIDQADNSLEDTLTPDPIGSSTSLSVTIPAADLKQGHTYTVVVSNPAPGGGDSDSSMQAATTLAVGNPVPTVTALSPQTVQAASDTFTLTITGTNFLPGATVNFNGATLTPTAITPTQITVTVPQAQVATDSAFYIYVTNPALNTAPAYQSPANYPAGYFTVTSPTPTLTSIDPNAGVLKTVETVTVTGSGFSTAFGTYLYFPNYGGISPTSVSPDGTSMTVDLPAGALTPVGTQNVYVANSGAITNGSSSQSATLPFTIQAVPNPVPTVTGLSASDKPVGSPGFYLSVYGSGFVPGAKIKFNGTPRPDTTFVSSGELNTRISNAEMLTATTDTVTVANPAPGGGDSITNANNVFTVGNPKPTLSTLSPGSVTAGSAGFRLHITGAGFIAGTTVNFSADTGLAPVVGTLASTALDVDIPAGDLTTAGVVNVTVTNPMPDGGTSAPLSFTINPGIVLTSLTFLTPVAGGTVPNGTVTLNAVTPSDVVVGLSSSDSAVIRVHRAVIVPAGSQSATFAINTYRSHVTKTVTIQASLNGVVLPKDLTITGR